MSRFCSSSCVLLSAFGFPTSLALTHSFIHSYAYSRERSTHQHAHMNRRFPAYTLTRTRTHTRPSKFCAVRTSSARLERLMTRLRITELSSVHFQVHFSAEEITVHPKNPPLSSTLGVQYVPPAGRYAQCNAPSQITPRLYGSAAKFLSETFIGFGCSIRTCTTL